MMDEATDGFDNLVAGCNPSSTSGELTSSYIATAAPTTVGLSGVRYFWTSGMGTIYFDLIAIPDTDGNVPPGGARVIQ